MHLATMIPEGHSRAVTVDMGAPGLTVHIIPLFAILVVASILAFVVYNVGSSVPWIQKLLYALIVVVAALMILSSLSII